MKSRLYIETTIPSYLVARPHPLIRIAADQQTTREWWDTRRHHYDLFTSLVVLEEASAGDAEMAAARMASLASLPLLPAHPVATALARFLLAQQIIPAVAADDAFHLAMAAVHRMDFRLTWNCKHIHNPHLERRIAAACEAYGVRVPVICTPAELLQL